MIYVIVNRAEDLEGAQTTAELARRLEVRRPGEVEVVGVDALSIAPGGAPSARERAIGRGDRVLVRTNPARSSRPADHGVALEILRRAERAGAVVMNAPGTLARAMTKAYLTGFDAALSPRTLISRDPSALRRFVESAPGRTVVKPGAGTRGRDVYAVGPGAPNLAQILDHLCRQGYVVAQDFVPEAAEGDVRVVVLGGRPLELDGELCAVRRVPQGDDFRSNVAVGGRAEPVRVSAEVRALTERAASALAEDGIHLAGLDVIGRSIIEANVFATGALPDASTFYERDFFAPVLDYFLALSPRPPSPRESPTIVS